MNDPQMPGLNTLGDDFIADAKAATTESLYREIVMLEYSVEQLRLRLKNQGRIINALVARIDLEADTEHEIKERDRKDDRYGNPVSLIKAIRESQRYS